MMRSLRELNPLLEGYYATYDGKIISRKNKLLKQFRRNKQSRCPYLSISVWDKDSGFARPFFVHRLVAYQYCDLYLTNVEGLVVNHIDGNPYNNNACNLEWVTQKENIHKSVNKI
jgi:hypothetical protein